MEINIAPGISVDPQAVMTGRCCIIGQSGSGKSYLVGVMAEELCRAALPFAIIDTEGEYSSLKSAFKMILVGSDGADLDINTDATRLFKSSIENNVPIVFDLSEVIEKDAYVESLLASLYSIEDKLRTPYLLIIEEADKFAPQVIHKTRNMVEEISVRGRKRGIGLIVATQRPANISKNVLAQCSYGFIGKLTTDNDIRAVDILFEDKKRLFEIPKLNTGEFLAFGLKYDEPFDVKARAVTAGGSTPKIRTASAPINLDEIIGKLSKKQPLGLHTSRNAHEKDEPDDVEITEITEKISKDDAELYAKSISQKKFLLFGDAVEGIDEIKKNYLYLILSNVRIPTKKKGVYEERSVLIDSKLRAITIDKKITARWFGGEKQFKLKDEEAKVLGALNLRKGLDSYGLAKQTGLDEYPLHAAAKRLANLELAYEKKNRLYPVDLFGSLSAQETELTKINADSTSIVNYSDKLKKAASERIVALFPGSQIISAQPVHLPFYSITLRKGNRVKVAYIDAVFGKKLDIL